MILVQTYGAINQDVQQFGLRMWNWSGDAGAEAVEIYGPCVVAAQVYLPGSAASQVYLPGCQKADTAC